MSACNVAIGSPLSLGLADADQRYRNACRIEYARELLTRSDLSIKEITAKTGYCNQFYFSQEFRRQTGYSPRCMPSVSVAHASAKAWKLGLNLHAKSSGLAKVEFFLEKLENNGTVDNNVYAQ